MQFNPDTKAGLAETKRALREAGFQVYDVKDGLVSLAERVRDNLILHSGISLRAAPPLIVVTLRAQALHFPGQSAERVLSHAEDLAQEFLRRGYKRVDTLRSEVSDPSHPDRTLDMVHGVVVERSCDSFEELLDEVRVAFSLPRASSDSDNPPPFSVSN